MKKYHKKPQNQASDKQNTYLKYAGLAFQIVGPIVVFAFIGQYLDHKLGYEKPILTLLLSVTAVIAVLYKLISNFSK